MMLLIVDFHFLICFLLYLNVLLYIFVLRGRKPSTAGIDPGAVDQNQDQGLINDLLDEVDDPLD